MALEKDLERDKKGPDYMFGLGSSIGQIGVAGQFSGTGRKFQQRNMNYILDNS